MRLDILRDIVGGTESPSRFVYILLTVGMVVFLTVELAGNSFVVRAAKQSADKARLEGAAIPTSDSSTNCPTGQPCGTTAPYCQSYTPPSIRKARVIDSLPYNIWRAGNYYLNSDLTSKGNGIYITYTGREPIDINLNGHTIIYGTVTNGSGASQVGEYGILMCNTGNLISEQLDSSYGSNGECAGGVRQANITIENGSIVQSPNASQYYDPNNCPGSGIGVGSSGAGCSNRHPSVASHVINMLYASGIAVRHLTLTWQNVDSDGIRLAWQSSGAPDKVECNTLNDKVTQLNSRAYENGEPIVVGSSQTTLPDTVQYNSIVGTPHLGINMQAPGGIIQYNDIEMAHYQAPPYTPALQSYSNDYGVGPFSCPVGGLISYNYIHGANGRGIGCILPGRGYADLNGLQIVGNYVTVAEQQTNGEYGPNGHVNGGAWVGGCEGGGGRDFETKGATSFVLKQNTLIYNVIPGGCGGAAIQTIALPCFGVSGCAATAVTRPISYENNDVEVLNSSGSSILPEGYASCYNFELVQGNARLNEQPIFASPIAQDNTCTTDGNYISTAPDSGDAQNLIFTDETFRLGSHPFSKGCGEPLNPCGQALNWNCGGPPPSDCTGFVLQDITLQNGAALNFYKWVNSPVASDATVQWTYTLTVMSPSGRPIAGAAVNTVDSGGKSSVCITDELGKCPVTLVETFVRSEGANAPLSNKSANPHVVTVTKPGCNTLQFNRSISRATDESVGLVCPESAGTN